MMLIVRVKDKPDFENLPEQAKTALQRSRAFNFVDSEQMMLGTKVVANRKLMFIWTEYAPNQLENITNSDETNEDGEVISVDLNLDIVAREDEPVDQSVLLPYFEDIEIVDENGDVIDTQPVTDLTGKLQTLAGREWTY